jgi:molecular chaperone GrpE
VKAKVSKKTNKAAPEEDQEKKAAEDPEENISEQAREEAEAPQAAEAPEESAETVVLEEEQAGQPAPPGEENALSAERDKYLRLYAEFDNFKKRSRSEREALYTDIRAETIRMLLPVYDNLERALQTPCADETYAKGIEMTAAQFSDILKNLGVEAVAAAGEKFDPAKHNAVMHIENPELEENTISEVFEKGFLLGDKVIRHATVVVAN